MSRSVTGRKPSPAEIHQLCAALEQERTARQRRRAEGLVRYAAGMEAAAIAYARSCHVHTVSDAYTCSAVFSHAHPGSIPSPG